MNWLLLSVDAHFWRVAGTIKGTVSEAVFQTAALAQPCANAATSKGSVNRRRGDAPFHADVSKQTAGLRAAHAGQRAEDTRRCDAGKEEGIGSVVADGNASMENRTPAGPRYSRSRGPPSRTS